MSTSNADWYLHYSSKNVTEIKHNDFIQNLINDIPYINVLQQYIQPGENILECGCGLARTCMSMAYSGYNVTGIDIEKKLLQQVRKNIARLKLFRLQNFLELKYLDFTKIKDVFGINSFKCITHQGVLEHFPEEEIIRLLDLQVEVASFVIFSIPIESEYNNKYFIDDIYRNLWTPTYWIKKILKKYTIIESRIAHQRSDNLIVVLKA